MCIRFSSILFFLSISFQLQAQREVTYSHALSSPIVIDGNATEWAQPFPCYDGLTKLEFSFLNDSQYLYLCVKTFDPFAQIRMLNAGLEFSINTSKRTFASISFPMQRERNSAQPSELLNSQRKDRTETKEIKRLMIAEVKTMKLWGFKSLPNGIYNIQIQQGINTAIGIDSLGILTAEYRIPFKLFLFVTDTAKPLSATIMLKGMAIAGGGMPPQSGAQSPSGGMDRDMEMPRGTDRNMGGTHPGGMGGSPPGGGPPPGLINGNGDSGQDRTIKIKLKLAA